eukprot:gene1153-biopygen12268
MSSRHAANNALCVAPFAHDFTSGVLFVLSRPRAARMRCNECPQRVGPMPHRVAGHGGAEQRPKHVGVRGLHAFHRTACLGGDWDTTCGIPRAAPLWLEGGGVAQPHSTRFCRGTSGGWAWSWRPARESPCGENGSGRGPDAGRTIKFKERNGHGPDACSAVSPSGRQPRQEQRAAHVTHVGQTPPPWGQDSTESIEGLHATWKWWWWGVLMLQIESPRKYRVVQNSRGRGTSKAWGLPCARYLARRPPPPPPCGAAEAAVATCSRGRCAQLLRSRVCRVALSQATRSQGNLYFAHIIRAGDRN